MFASYTFWLIVLAVLIIYLCSSVVLRLRAEELENRRANERLFTRKAFNASAIAPQIQQLQARHFGAAHSRKHPHSNRSQLVAAARQMVIRLSYFNSAAHSSDGETHHLDL